MSQGWQQPYVNLFKKYDVGEWKKCSKEGEVSKIMDRTVKSSVYRLSGIIQSANFIQVPHPKSPPLGLTGHMFYLLFKPVVGKFFSIHLDISSSDGTVVRVSLSNMFKEFKLTSTWLQFPIVPNPTTGSVEEATVKNMDFKDYVGTVPNSTRWTLLCIDMQYILSVYLNKHFLYLKKLRLCSTMFVKNAFTSNNDYEPGVDIKLARKTGLLASGVVPLPREMAFPLEKHETWHLKYDYIRFPAKEKQKVSYQNMIPGKAVPFAAASSTVKHSLRKSSRDGSEKAKAQSSEKVVKSRVALAEKVTSALMNQSNTVMHSSAVHSNLPVIDNTLEYSSISSKKMNNDKKKPHSKNITVKTNVGFNNTPDFCSSVLPEVSVVEQNEFAKSFNDVHIYASPTMRKYKGKENASGNQMNKTKLKKKITHNALQPDPILLMKKILGFGGGTYKHAVWLDDEIMAYPSQSAIVITNVRTGKANFLLGHTNKISCIECSTDRTLFASSQVGENSVLRLWKTNVRKCISVFHTQMNNVKLISFSTSGNSLCAVGEDPKGKQVVKVWDISAVPKGGKVSLLAKANTGLKENNINCIKFTPFDNERMVSCGNHNIRVWRVKANNLRSCPVDLHQFANVEFKDFVFEEFAKLVQDITNRSMYFTTSTGFVYEVNYKTLKIQNMHHLLPINKKNNQTETTVGLNTISYAPNFIVTGSDDGCLRLWSKDFKSVLLEAEHDGAVCLTAILNLNTKLLAGTSTGNLGILDISSKSYATLTRSHTAPIISFAFETIHHHVATISNDNSIKIWDAENLNQVYDFQATDEIPLAIACHPRKAEFACGFKNGSVRLFSLATTSMMFELKEHREEVHCLLFSPNGEYMYTAGQDRTLVLYEACNDSYNVLRTLPNMISNGDVLPTHLMTIDENGQHLAVIGPTDIMITVFSARSLDELLHIDITSMACPQSTFNDDIAVGILYAPAIMAQLLVATSSSRLLKFDSNTGQLLSEFSGLHQGQITSLCCSNSGRYLATAGDQCIKVWDYHIDDPGKFQVFVGHSSPIHLIRFSPDNQQLISVGETLFMWDFLACKRKNEIDKVKPFQDDVMDQKKINEFPYDDIAPRVFHPQPVEALKEFSTLDINKYHIMENKEKLRYPTNQPSKYVHSQANADKADILEDEEDGNECVNLKTLDTLVTDSHDIDFNINRSNEVESSLSDDEISSQPEITPSLPLAVATAHHAPPNVMMHFKARERISELASKRYAAPPLQAGLKLSSSVGCNGNARHNVAWHPETGLFLYSSGCTLVLEDLSNGQQRLLQQHTEEIATIALQNDGQIVATGGSCNKTTENGIICIWYTQNGALQKVLEIHQCSVIALAYSRDDRYLVSIGDSRECSVVVWCAENYFILSQSRASFPIHAVQWHPFKSNEFVTVGRKRTVLFWYISDEKEKEFMAAIEGEVPQGIFVPSEGNDDMTAVCYADREMMFTSTAQGVVCIWNVKNQTCLMHWKADVQEIGILIARNGKLITGSVSKNLYLWSLPFLEQLNTINTNMDSVEMNGLSLDNEKKLDGGLTSAMFDDTLEMGIVGTTNGTVWYINWNESEDIRLVNGHPDKVSTVSFCDGYFATSNLDGGLRLWNIESREQSSQFLVIGQGCTCVSFCSSPQSKSINTIETYDYNQIKHPVKCSTEHPSQCVAGYQDGTFRMFDFGRMEMILKVKPHSDTISAITSSFDGRVIISGCVDGLIAVNSMVTGMAVRIISDHRGAPICSIKKQEGSISSLLSVWLTSSNDRRISVWQADWSKDSCDLIDWITFPGLALKLNSGSTTKTNNQNMYHPPTLASFNQVDDDMIIYTGYGLQKEISLYSLGKKKVIKTIALSDWVISLDVSSGSSLIAAGFQDRLLKLIDMNTGTFQDFIGHSDSISTVKFSSRGTQLITCADTELFIWSVLV